MSSLDGYLYIKFKIVEGKTSSHILFPCGGGGYILFADFFLLSTLVD
jgi:hypothetical protein